MNDPIHEITIPLVKAVSAECLAVFALGEHRKALLFAGRSRFLDNNGGDIDHEGVAFWLNDAAEWRRVYQACIKAIDVMGGL